jgi:hypothetical protein
LVLIALLAAFLLLPRSVHGLSGGPSGLPTVAFREGVRVEILAGGGEEFARVGVSRTASITPTSTFVVTYTGFTAQAQTAFQAAVDIWAGTVVSSVPIRVNATWSALGTNVLGSAGPVNFANFGSSPPSGAVADTWYPIALANALSGSDVDPTRADISASFSSAWSAWYFGTDGNTPSNLVDFESVVMHEIGHGLGFMGTMSSSGGTGSWGFGSPVKPTQYDRLTVNGSNQNLTTAFTNPSTALGTQLVSNNIFFSGTNAVAANGGVKPKLYAPATWSGGSSISHLDDATFPPSSGNALMTHSIGYAETEHDPGPIVKGIFADIGWQINGGGGGGGGNPVPAITSLSPSSKAAGSSSFTLTVNGSGFVNGSVISFGGTNKTTTFVSSIKLTATVSASDVSSQGTRNVKVTSPGPGGGTSNTVTFTVTASGGGGGSIPSGSQYLSLATAQVLGGVSVAPDDIVAKNGSSYIMLFDGSVVGLGALSIDAFQVLSDGTILLSFSAAGAVPNIGSTVDGADIVKFTPTVAGNYSAGTFSMFFDGSDIGLSGSAENVDAFSYVSGKLRFSTSGAFTLTSGLAGANRDVAICKAFVSGGSTSCTNGTGTYFDGDDIGLTLATENMDALFVGPTGTIYYSTAGAFASGAVSGAGGDVVACTSPTTGGSSACASQSIVLNAAGAGIVGNVTGFGIAP